MGFTEEQAEAIADLATDHLVTTEYFDMRIKELELRLTIKLGTVVATGVAAIAILIKLL